MEKLPKRSEPVSREVVERIAHIIGENSAAARALTELDKRLASGENVVILLADHGFFVCPAKSEIAIVSD